MRIIAHLDMDAFFASVEERDKPRLAGRPIVVGSDPKEGLGRGVVSTANYKAREYGIRSAMPISKAWRLAQEAKQRGFPEAAFVMPDFVRYTRASSRIMDIIRTFSRHVEIASIDEAYADLSECGNYEAAGREGSCLQKEIREKERLSCSVGIGQNKLIAKIASDRKKPGGLTIVQPQETQDFLDPLPARVIPGIGPKTAAELERIGTQTIKDIRRFSEDELKYRFGKHGSEIFRKARGIDEADLIEEWEAKSIGEQGTFLTDTKNIQEVFEAFHSMCEDVARRFRESEYMSFKTVTITVRFADFTTRTRAHTLGIPTNSAEILNFEATKLLLPFFDARENPKKQAIRLIGVRIEHLA